MRAFRTMLKTELKLSLRGMDMFIFAICMPVVVTILLGIIYGNKSAFDGAGYTFLEQSFGAITTIAICAGYAIASLILVYATAAIFFDFQFNGSWLQFLGSYFLVMGSMFSIGIMVGGIAPNLKAASVIASILYFPMLIFSGATLPYEVMPTALQKCSNILPLTQGIKLLKAASLGLTVDSVMMPIIVMIALGVICTGVALRFFK